LRGVVRGIGHGLRLSGGFPLGWEKLIAPPEMSRRGFPVSGKHSPF
jgi:hypothetical protein